MFCPKCGYFVGNTISNCPKCGASINREEKKIEEPNNNEEDIEDSTNDEIEIVEYENNNRKKFTIAGLFLGVGLLSLFIGIYKVLNDDSTYYFSNDGDSYTVSSDIKNNYDQYNEYSTMVIADNVYKGISVKNEDEANSLIVKDSIDNKTSCNPEILKIENEIISKYNITAVNLCEMDLSFAKELEKVLDVIYKEYPKTRGYLTNLTLTNVIEMDSYIAAFMPVFKFVTNDNGSYPFVIKTQILLNSNYFLNRDKLNRSITFNSDYGYFPKNASESSPVAHELGHYLSFIAMMEQYKTDSILLIKNRKDFSNLCDLYNDFLEGDFSYKLLQEAFANHQKNSNENITFTEWRGRISFYALAKDNEGNDIYDETIAEAFHDVYLNNKKASGTSQEIVKVLKKYLEG